MKPLTAFLLTLGIIVVMVANSADFFFHRPYYEYWDLAANSLSVIRAKHFAELYGSYSRWGFHHPGPVFFYVQALGEWLFYDLLGLTPAPFNAQTLGNLCLTVSFFVAGIASFSHWLSAGARRWFVPAALAVATVHFGAVARMPSYDMLLGCTPFSSAWTAHSWVFPFLCMLTAGASVAAGRGENLTLLALADCFLVHAHIAAPMFVGPMTLLAYAGLLATSIARERAAGAADASDTPLWRRAWRMSGSAWRAYPRRHIVAVTTMTLFALPMVIDLFRGDASNFHAVLMHMKYHHGQHKKLIRSLFYFVQFGAYRPYRAHIHMFKQYDKAGAYHYLRVHWKIYAAWIFALLLVLWSSVLRPALVALGRWHEDADAAAVPAAPTRLRFLAWAGAFLVLSIFLTLYWGIIQDGEMFYYSGWINFAIYYFGLLIVLAEFSSVLSGWAERQKQTGRAWVWIERLLPAGVLVLACVLEAGRFAVCDPTPEVTRALHESYLRVVGDANARNPHGIKILNLPFLSWPIVTGLALEMERQGQPYMVVGVFTTCFPQSQRWQPSSLPEQEAMEVWHFKLGKQYKLLVSGAPKWWISRGATLERQLAAVRQHPVAPDQTMSYPLLDDVELTIDVPKLDPNSATGASLDFRQPFVSFADRYYGFYKHPKFALILKEVGSAPACALYGFNDLESWGMWNTSTAGVLRLRGEPVGASDDVEMLVDARPFLDPDNGLTAQRLRVAVNRTPLGPEASLADDQVVTYTVPGALWNRTFAAPAGAAVEFGFPDAVAAPKTDAPATSLDKTPQLRGIGLRGICFRTVRAAHSQPALVLDGPDHRARIDFTRGGNASAFESGAWPAPEAWGTWNGGHAGTLHFHSAPVDGAHDVEITLDIHAVMNTDSGIGGQRVRASLGDNPIDRERTVTTPGSLVWTVPATVWNAAVANDADAELRLDFPDAVSPARIDASHREQDNRLLALGIKGINFCEVVPHPLAAK